MFRRHYFKTLEGSSVPANRITLFFVDRNLEADYVSFLAMRHHETFKLISKIAISWAIITGALNYIIRDRIPDMAYPIAAACVIGAGLTYAGEAVIRSAKYRHLFEYLYTVTEIVYVGMFVAYSIITNRWYSKRVDFRTLDEYHYNYLWLESLSVIVVTFACLFRRRLPFALLSTVFLIITDLAISTEIVGYTLSRIMQLRIPALLAALLTTGVYVYQTEIDERTEFLNTRENEKWKINADDVQILRVLGRGTFGQVFEGFFRNYRVAAKFLFIKQEVEPKVKPKSKNGGLRSFLRRVHEQLYHLWTGTSRRQDYQNLILEERKRIIESESNFDRFEKEIRIMCKLRHPNIVKFMGACLQRPKMLLLVEYCENGSLFEFLAKNKSSQMFTSLVKLRIALGCAHALQYLHAQHPPILHRDFKSPNVLLDSSLNPKVCDFGLSEWQHTESGHFTGETTDNQINTTRAVGTVPWIAPEIFLGQKHSSESDLYSFAVVCWEIFTEQRPYAEDFRAENGKKSKFTNESLIQAIVRRNHRPKIPADIEKTRFVTLFTRAWHSQPVKRPKWNEIIEEISFLCDEEAQKEQRDFANNSSLKLKLAANESCNTSHSWLSRPEIFQADDVTLAHDQMAQKYNSQVYPDTTGTGTQRLRNEQNQTTTVAYKSQKFIRRRSSFAIVSARQLIENEAQAAKSLHATVDSIADDDAFYSRRQIYLDSVIIDRS